MTLREPRGDETDEEALQRLGIQEEEKKLEKKILKVAHWDEFWGPVYACPFCQVQKLNDGFKFCPICGRSLQEFVFEEGVR